MATIYKEVTTHAPPADVWDAIRDIGSLHTRLVPGFVLETTLIPGGRRVRFANGLVVEEPIIECNDILRRLAWSAQGGSTGLKHYNSAVQVFAREAGGSRIVWTADLLPHEAAPAIEQMMQQGSVAMARALGAVCSPGGPRR